MAIAKHAIKIEGIKELRGRLQRLPDRIERKVIKSSVGKAATPIVKTAQKEAPRGKHKAEKLKALNRAGHAKDVLKTAKAAIRATQLYRAIGKKAKVYPRNRFFVIVIGNVLRAFQAHLVEFGTKGRHHRNGKWVGATPANPFMQRAWDKEIGKAEKRISQELLSGTLAEIKKMERAS